MVELFIVGNIQGVTQGGGLSIVSFNIFLSAVMTVWDFSEWISLICTHWWWVTIREADIVNNGLALCQPLNGRGLNGRSPTWHILLVDHAFLMTISPLYRCLHTGSVIVGPECWSVNTMSHSTCNLSHNSVILVTQPRF